MATTSGNAEVDEALELLASGQTEAAEAIAMKILGVQPTDAYATLIWGHGLVDRGELDDAIATFENAVRWAPTAPEMRFALASAIMRKASTETPHFRGWRWAQARSAADIGLELSPGHPDGLRIQELVAQWEASDAEATIDRTPREMLGRSRTPPSGSQRLANGPTKEAMVDRLTFVAVARLVAPFVVLAALVAFRVFTKGLTGLFTPLNIIGTLVIVLATWGGLRAWLGPRLADRRGTIEF